MQRSDDSLDPDVGATVGRRRAPWGEQTPLFMGGQRGALALTLAALLVTLASLLLGGEIQAAPADADLTPPATAVQLPNLR